jgi:hypothetical protein
MTTRAAQEPGKRPSVIPNYACVAAAGSTQATQHTHMSIYDREYIRMGPRSKSGLGSLRFISFNSWIIIINVVVFLVDIALSGHVVPVVIDLQASATLEQNRSDGPPVP